MSVVLVTSPDWEGLYVDGVLRAEDHQLELKKVIHLIRHGVAIVQADDSNFEKDSHFPELLSQVSIVNE